MAEIKEPIESFGLSQRDKSNSLFSKIGVVGCGQEGRTIVSLTALSGMDVVFVEVSDDRIKDALNAIEHGLDTKIQNWGLTQGEKKSTMSRIKGSTDYSDLRGCDFVVECIRYEVNGEKSTEMRKDVFTRLEAVLAPDAIIATNATTVIISELASVLKHQDRCISLHFPVSHADARLLEIARGTFTSDEVAQKVDLFAKMIRYTPSHIHESSGMVNMRLMVIMLNEACEILMEGIASLEDIDKQFTISYGQRHGIFELADILGIEKIVMLMEDMFGDYGDRKYKANPILWRLYRSKQHGVKTRRGFYKYDQNGKNLGVNDLI